MIAEHRENKETAVLQRCAKGFGQAGGRETLGQADDEARTWTKPVVIARQPKAELSYPYVIERRPGELWVIVRYGPKPCFSLREADVVPERLGQARWPG